MSKPYYPWRANGRLCSFWCSSHTSTSWIPLWPFLWHLLRTHLQISPTTPPSSSSPIASSAPSLHAANECHPQPSLWLQSSPPLPASSKPPLLPASSEPPPPPASPKPLPPVIFSVPPPLDILPPPLAFLPPPPDTFFPLPPSFKVPSPPLPLSSSEGAPPPDERLLHPWGMVI